MCHRTAVLSIEERGGWTCSISDLLRPAVRLVISMALLLAAMAAPRTLAGQQSRLPKDQPQICTLPQQDEETESSRLKTNVKINNRSADTDADCPQTETDTNKTETDINKADAENQQAEAESSPEDPVVRYRDGLLSVSSTGATLEAVLDRVREDTGITVSASGDGLQRRVFDKVGPAPLRDALVSLLYGTGLNYIIQSSSNDLQSVRSVILTAEALPDSQAAPKQTPASGETEERGVYGGFKVDPEAASATEAEAASPSNAQMNSQANPSSITGVPAGFDVQKAAAEANKTPGQILSELQQKQIEILDAQTPPEQ
jgi:hypothetical protein